MKPRRKYVLENWAKGLTANGTVRKQRLKRLTKRDYNLRAKYGISEEQYNSMYQDQQGKCYICNKYKPLLVVDHNHETGKVRKLLCTSCNTALGKFQDSIEVLDKALKYLKSQ